MGSHRENQSGNLRSRFGRVSRRKRDELTQISIGNNRFRAQVIAEACGAAGLKVKLLFSDDSGYGNVEAHRLLVFVDDLKRVAKVIERADAGGSPDRSR